MLLSLRFPPEYAGGGLQASRLMENLTGRGVEMTALSLVPEGASAPRRESAFGGRVIRFAVSGPGLVRDIGLSLRAGWWLLAHPRWDLLHVSSFSWFALVPMLVAKVFGRPVLVKTTLLGDKGAFNPSGGWLGARLLSLYQRADAIVALSRALEDDLRSRPGLRAKLVRIPNGVDVEFFRPAEVGEKRATRETFGLPQEASIIVTSSMLNRRKNVAALVRAAGGVATRPVCVVLVGPRGTELDYFAEVEAAIAALPEGVEVRELGKLAPERLAQVLRAADVYALVSRSEGLPNSLLEGMATGLPCVATDIPGSADVLEAGGGKLVPLDDEPALSAALEGLFLDAEAASRMGLEARATILEDYSFARIGDQYSTLYDALLGSGGA